jgi:hypothetical protein
MGVPFPRGSPKRMRTGFVNHPDRRRGLVRIAGRSENPDQWSYRPCLRGRLLHWECPSGLAGNESGKRPTSTTRKSTDGNLFWEISIWARIGGVILKFITSLLG